MVLWIFSIGMQSFPMEYRSNESNPRLQSRIYYFDTKSIFNMYYMSCSNARPHTNAQDTTTKTISSSFSRLIYKFSCVFQLYTQICSFNIRQQSRGVGCFMQLFKASLAIDYAFQNAVQCFAIILVDHRET